MPLTIITGKKKSGKTAYVLKQLKLNKSSTVIVPEQTVFLYEKNILSALEEEGVFTTDILSFKKLAKKLLKNDRDFNRVKLLDKDTRALLTEKIILSGKDKLIAFKNAAGNPDFSQKISTQISEFKKYLINSERLQSVCGDTRISKSLKDKLCDLSYIYGEFEKRIKDIYCDLDDLIVTAADKIAKEKLYKNKNVYIDAFTGFTGEELYMIKSLLLSGANVFITLTDIPDASDYGDFGYTLKRTFEKLEALAKDVGETVRHESLDGSFFEKQDLKYIADNYLRDNAKEYGKECESLKIVKCKGIKNECDALASQIVSDIKNSGARPGEMAVVISDMAEYSDYVKIALSGFNLSAYSNEKKSVYDMPVAALLSSVFNILLSGNRMDVILGYLKSGYFMLDAPEKIYVFEEFVRKTGVRAYRLLSTGIDEIIAEKESFNFKIHGRDSVIEVYNRVLAPVVKLKKKILSLSDASEYSLALYEFFSELELEKALSTLAGRYEARGDIASAKQLIQVYNYILESMERTTLVLSGMKVSFTEYKNIIISGLKNKNIASIPILNDSIYITGPTGFFNDSYKYIYVLGANEGKLPEPAGGEGIINEAEREQLTELGIELSMSARLKIMENTLKLYDIVTSPEKKIYISYSQFSRSASELLPSRFLSELSALTKKDISDCEIIFKPKRRLLKDVLGSVSKKELKGIEKELAYLSLDSEYKDIVEGAIEKMGKSEELEVRVNKANMKKLLKDTLRVSTTNMEKYNSCSFAYFLNYILRVKEKEEFIINSANLGSVIHLVLEKFSRILKEDGETFKTVDDAYINKKLPGVIDKAINETQNGVFASDIKSTVFKKKIWAISLKTVNLLRTHFIKGSFETEGFEVSFGKEDSTVKGIVFDVGDNRKVILNGVIDRVDKYKVGDEEYIRIVDYKSSEKTIQFYEVAQGVKMQLAVYLMTMIGKEKIDKIKPGGMLYLALTAPVVKLDSPEEIGTVKDALNETLSMKGFYLNTHDIAEAMDIDFKTMSKSDIVDLELDKDGIPKDKNSLSISEFEQLLTIVKGNIEKTGKSIFDGVFDINPVEYDNYTSCDYCPYLGVCMFDKENSRLRSIEKLKRDEIFK
ncbi:MAG: hypothetical protein E7411_06695 [Ruminococcaceae bacterium]|nr:hypothetical protein [Oscillospiraceae bacterium]